jgi:hypothetical protein
LWVPHFQLITINLFLCGFFTWIVARSDKHGLGTNCGRIRCDGCISCRPSWDKTKEIQWGLFRPRRCRGHTHSEGVTVPVFLLRVALNVMVLYVIVNKNPNRVCSLLFFFWSQRQINDLFRSHDLFFSF